jgi:hypothetical protein
MEYIPPKLWVVLLLSAAALVANFAFPLAAAGLGIVAGLVLLWLLMGGK